MKYTLKNIVSDEYKNRYCLRIWSYFALIRENGSKSNINYNVNNNIFLVLNHVNSLRNLIKYLHNWHCFLFVLFAIDFYRKRRDTVEHVVLFFFFWNPRTLTIYIVKTWLLIVLLSFFVGYTQLIKFIGKQTQPRISKRSHSFVKRMRYYMQIESF